MRRARPYAAAALSGAVWAGLASLLVGEAASERLADAAVFGALAGPAIGVLVYAVSRWTYKRAGWLRVVWSVPSLYLAVGLYGLVLGLYLEGPGLQSGTQNPEAAFETALSLWFGLTFIPVLWFAFILAYTNHELIRRMEPPVVR